MEIIPLPETDLKIIEKEPRALDKSSPEERAARKQAEAEEKKLADVVCEKYKKGDSFVFSLENRGGSFSIILDGVKVGTFGLRNNGNTKQVGFILLNENLRHKGFGKQLYIKLNQYFKKTDGSVLMSDTMRVSADADNLWRSLVREGLAEETSIDTADGHKVYRFKNEIPKDEGMEQSGL